MPNFNKGTFEGVQYEAIPVGKFRIFSSVFRWYRPYAPGDYINFKLKLKSLDKQGSGIRLSYYVGEKETGVVSLFCENKLKTTTVDGIPTPSEGTVSYCLKPVFDNNKSVVVVSVVPIHNDQWVSIIFGALITMLCTLLAWLLNGFIHLRTFWEMWIPLNLK